MRRRTDSDGFENSVWGQKWLRRLTKHSSRAAKAIRSHLKNQEFDEATTIGTFYVTALGSENGGQN